jgi:hypothetical protein
MMRAKHSPVALRDCETSYMPWSGSGAGVKGWKSSTYAKWVGGLTSSHTMDHGPHIRWEQFHVSEIIIMMRVSRHQQKAKEISRFSLVFASFLVPRNWKMGNPETSIQFETVIVFWWSLSQ